MLSTDGSADVSHQDICAFFNNSGEGLGDRVHGFLIRFILFSGSPTMLNR